MKHGHQSIATMNTFKDLLGTTWGVLAIIAIFCAVAAIVTILILT